MDKLSYIIDSFETFGHPISEKQAKQFLTYEELLTDWNQRMNLTAITDFEEIVWKHFVDSVAVCQSSRVSRETLRGRLIDVGTGAGFPGVPLKILFPDLKLTLLDSLNKRIDFLKTVTKECGLDHVEMIHGRAEDVAHDARYREQYNVCVSRAVANMSTLSEYCLPFLAKGGHFIAYKSGEASHEIRMGEKAVKVFGGEIKSVETFVLKGTDLSRMLVDIQKIQNTPKKYPRKAGTPSKKPIE